MEGFHLKDGIYEAKFYYTLFYIFEHILIENFWGYVHRSAQKDIDPHITVFTFLNWGIVAASAKDPVQTPLQFLKYCSVRL
jgi:hypothetical protein